MRRDRSGTIRFLWFLIAGSVALPILLFAYASWLNYSAAFEAADERIDGALTIAEENAGNLFRSSELILIAADELVANRSDDEVRANEVNIHEVLRRLAASLKGVNSIWIFGADGVPLVTSAFYPAPRTFSNVDRDYFKAQVESDAGTYVGAVVAPKVPGQEIYTVSRRRSGDRFTGVAAVAIKVADTEAFYRAVGSAPGSYFALLRSDGLFLARYPASVAIGLKLTESSTTMRSIAAKPEAGINTLISQTDGVRRRLGYRKLANFPVYVLAGFEEAVIVNEWWQLMASHLVFGVPATALLFAALIFGLLRTQRLYREAEARASAEAALRQSQKMEAIGQLTGGVAHDFNNLLTIVLGNLETAKRTLEQPSDAMVRRVQRAVDSAFQGAQRAATLTQRLLAFSRRQPLTPRVIQVNSAIQESADLFKRALGENRRLELLLDSSARNIRVDPSQFDVAVLNLIVNARDAIAADGSVCVKTFGIETGEQNDSSGLELPPGSFTVVEVSDNGAGMSTDALSRAFEPFFTTKASGRGTGLGLSQVYGFVKQSGGDTVIESKLGEGTTVRMYFPSVLRPAEPILTRPQAAVSRGSNQTVLVVEDDDHLRSHVVEMLRDLNYIVHEAENGTQALQTVAREGRKIDLLLTDVMMPGLSGCELAERVRTSRPEIEVLYMTGYAGDAMPLEGGSGRHPIIRKPFTRDEIAERVYNALHRSVNEAERLPETESAGAGKQL